MTRYVACVCIKVFSLIRLSVSPDVIRFLCLGTKTWFSSQLRCGDDVLTLFRPVFLTPRKV